MRENKPWINKAASYIILQWHGNQLAKQLYINKRSVLRGKSQNMKSLQVYCRYEYSKSLTFRALALIVFSLWRRANARNVRLYYPYRQYTKLFVFRFVALCTLVSDRRAVVPKWCVHGIVFKYKIKLSLQAADKASLKSEQGQRQGMRIQAKTVKS